MPSGQTGFVLLPLLLLTLWAGAAAACPSNSAWMGDSWEGKDQVRNCQCLPGYIPKGNERCVAHDKGADPRRLPDGAGRLVTEVLDLGMPGFSHAARALRDRIAQRDPFATEAQQALSFLEGMEFMDRLRNRQPGVQASPLDPRALAKEWAEYRDEDLLSVIEPPGGPGPNEPQWLVWLRTGRDRLVDEALLASGNRLREAEAHLRAKLGEPPVAPRANAYRFVQGMMLHGSGR